MTPEQQAEELYYMGLWPNPRDHGHGAKVDAKGCRECFVWVVAAAFRVKDAEIERLNNVLNDVNGRSERLLPKVETVEKQFAQLRSQLAEAAELIEMAAAHCERPKNLFPEMSLFERLTSGFDEVLKERGKYCAETFRLRAALAEAEGMRAKAEFLQCHGSCRLPPLVGDRDTSGYVIYCVDERHDWTDEMWIAQGERKGGQ